MMPHGTKKFLLSLIDTEGDDRGYADKVKRTVIRNGLAKIKLAAKIRREISLIYKRYNLFSRIAQAVLKNDIKHFDVKRAVDAIHYFGGGYPNEHSKGRMEGLLDAMVGMYKTLDFIGEGEMVEQHLAKHGVIIKILKDRRLKDGPIDPTVSKHIVEKHGLLPADSKSELVRQVIFHCNDLQTLICREADKIRDTIRPRAMDELEIEVPEFNRLTHVVRMKMGSDRTQDKIKDKVADTETSMESFQLAAKEIKIPEPKKPRPE